MATGSLTLTDGTLVEIKGTEEGVAKILALYNASLHPTAVTRKKRGKVAGGKGKQGANKPQPKEGLQTRVEELIGAGFFKQAKTPLDVVAKLLTKGFKHSRPTVSTALIRLVKTGKLDRHWNDETKRWNYINL